MSIMNVILDTATKYGINPKSFAKVANIESKFDVNAKSNKSSAGGLFQFTDKTAKSYGLVNKFDAVSNADAAARLWLDNARGLRKRLGREPTDGEVYLAHQQGLGAAIKLLSNPESKAVDVVGKKAVFNNGGNSKMTAAQFASQWVNRVDGTPETVVDSGPRFGDVPQSHIAQEEAGSSLSPNRSASLTPLPLGDSGGRTPIATPQLGAQQADIYSGLTPLYKNTSGSLLSLPKRKYG